MTELNTEILKLTDRCDQCSAQAYVQVMFDTGELLFCAHHWTEHAPIAAERASRIIDERHRLSPTKEPYGDQED
jgi:hypothetical protein